MDVAVLKETIGESLLRICFVLLAALCVAYAGIWFHRVLAGLQSVVKRYGWPFLVVFIVCSAWAAYTAFPTSEEKGRSGGVGHVGMDAVESDASRADGGDRVSTPTNFQTAFLSSDDFARGFVLTQVGTNECHDFTPPAGASVCADWRDYGAAEDWVYLNIEDSRSRFGTNDVNFLRVFSWGEVHPVPSSTNTYFAPFKARLGIVPEVNRSRLAANGRPSQFWHAISSRGSLLLTWQNVLLNRQCDKPVSFQIETFENGDFIYRYDLSSLRGRTDETDGAWYSNVFVGASLCGNEFLPGDSQNTNDFLAAFGVSALRDTLLSSLSFRHLEPGETPAGDRDGDGLTLEDELFVYQTDPYCPDTDYDGLSDSDEIKVYGTDPLDAYSSGGRYHDGLAVKIGNLNPFDCPPGSTNTVLEHIVYSGTPDGDFSYPEASDTRAVLAIRVSGSGSGRLVIGHTVVPLLAEDGLSPLARSTPGSPPPLFVPIMKGRTFPLILQGDSTLCVDLDSEAFAFGVLPTFERAGSVNFPNTVSTVPCIHDFYTKQTTVTLPVGEDAADLICTWQEGTGTHVENLPPRSAVVSARPDGELAYTLGHPRYLFGKTVYAQGVRFCPVPPEPEDGHGQEVPPWHPGGGGNSQDENGDTEEINPDLCWCCAWGNCDVECNCLCGGGCRSEDEEEGEYPGQTEHDSDETCPQHHVPYQACSDLHETEYEQSKRTFPPLGDVLYIRESPVYEPLELEVPETFRNCCPCPEHWKKYVSVAYQDRRLKLVDGNGLPFKMTDTSCTVRLSGISPSALPGDASLLFARNGEIYREYSKTVLGVEIKGEREKVEICHALNPAFGCPVTVSTNMPDNALVRLVTNVNLPTGNISLSLTDVSGSFSIWYFDPETGGHRRLLDSETMKGKNLSFAEWKKVMKTVSGSKKPELPVFVTSSRSGSATLVFRYWAVIDGRFVEDSARCVLRSVSPPILADMNYDNAINEADVEACLANRYFRFWTNDGIVKGDYAGQISDTSANASDLMVNGLCDLVNFFPLAVDLTSFYAAWGGSVTYRLMPSNTSTNAFNFCFADIPPDNLRFMQTGVLTASGGKALSAADLIAMPADGYVFSADELARLSAREEMLVVEAKAPFATVVLSVEREGQVLYSYTAALSLSSVHDMYRWLDIRSAAGDGQRSLLASHWNRPDDECDGRHFVFVHGYNVDGTNARSWSAEMFKRLWWAGSKSMFTAAAWRGDSSQFALMFSDKKISPDYYANVKNAFLSAPAFARDCNALPGKKVILAHSLGNMLVSSAAKDHGLVYSKYYMLNAAVPMEAYDMDADNSEMIDAEWINVPLAYRVSDWSSLFPPNDFRSSLSWRGRFAGINNAINCYSSTEDVLANAQAGQFTFSGSVWKIQELTKGTTVWHEINMLPFLDLDVACEGGWGINTYYSLNPLWYVYQYGFTGKVQSDLTHEDAITHPLFTPFRSESESMHSTNLFTLADASYRDELRAKFLADAISATSFAAGANHTGGLTDNYNLQSNTPNGWPKQRERNSANGIIRQWLHSDLKDVAFFYVYCLFNKIVNEE